MNFSRWRTRTAVSDLQFTEGERDKDEIVVEEWYSSQIAVPAVLLYYAAESAERPTLFCNEVL